MRGITIDGQYFDIPILEFNRSAEFLDRSATRTTDGVLHRELIGTYFNYQIKVGIIKNTQTYKSLWKLITKPVNFHYVSVPDIDDTYSFSCYVAGISDSGVKIYDNNIMFSELSIEFIAEKPVNSSYWG